VRLRILLAFAATWLIWGSTYLAIAFAVAEIPPFLMAGIRNLAAGLALYGWLRWRGAPRPTAAQWRTAALLGFLLLGIGNGAVSWAEQDEPSGVVALVVSLVPLWLMAFGWIGRAGVRPLASEVLGIVAGLVGVALLISPWGERDAVLSTTGLLVLLAGTIAWSGGSILARTFARTQPKLARPLLGSGMEMIAGGLSLLLASLATGEWQRASWDAVTLRGAGSLLYLIVAGSIIGFSAYKWLLTQVRPAIAGTYAFVNPVVAVALGAAFAGEPFSERIVLAMALITGAVATITLRPYLSRR
jgi:drug/metabolite transporter (DMT)-like permease